MLDKIKILQSTKAKPSLKNRNNLLSVFAEFQGKKVKVYENFNQSQVELRLFIEEEASVCNYFPRVVHHEGLYIAEEFVKGKEAFYEFLEEADLRGLLSHKVFKAVGGIPRRSRI